MPLAAGQHREVLQRLRQRHLVAYLLAEEQAFLVVSTSPSVVALVALEMPQPAQRVDERVRFAQLPADRQPLLQQRPCGPTIPALHGDSGQPPQRLGQPYRLAPPLEPGSCLTAQT